MKDNFEQLMKDRLGNHEVPVDPALWKSISTSAGISTGGWGLGAWLGVFSGVVVLTASIFYFTVPSEKTNDSHKDNTTIVAPVATKDSASKVEINNIAKEQAEITKPIIIREDEVVPSIINEGNEIGSNEAKTINNSSPEEKTVMPVLPMVRPQKVESQINTKENVTTSIVPSETQEELKETKIIMPNAITPNGDGVNDVLTLKCEGLQDFSVVVLDANNKVVYQANNTAFEWNGTLPNGDPAPQGVYSYYYTGKDNAGKWQHQFSSLTILR